MRVLSILFVCFFFFSCSSKSIQLEIKNSTSQNRLSEMIEIAQEDIFNLLGVTSFENLKVTDANHQDVDFQWTADKKLIFLANVDAQSSKTYHIVKGVAQPMDTLVLGRQYPERLDDVAWENDLMAYRTYGPAFQNRGDLGFGYDVWTKSVTHPVVEERYRKELQEKISYHVDHGDGMDRYGVGPSLGGGANALLRDAEIIYPKNYIDYEILDNGPLRFTVRLCFHPFAVGENEKVVEERVISLDKGSHLNRTDVRYENLQEPTDVLAGIVVHSPNEDTYVMNQEVGYIAYTDPTEDMSGVNGEIYVGLSFPYGVERTEFMPFSKEEVEKNRGNILGHLVGVNTLNPGGVFSYYWGAAWSKAHFENLEAWNQYLHQFTEQKKVPLTVSIRLTK